jgi:carboxyl-terminal processing protease
MVSVRVLSGVDHVESSEQMRSPSFRPVVILVAAVLLTGSAAGVLFGERSVPDSEAAVVLRASRVVDSMLEWLPEAMAPEDVIYDGIHGMLEVLDPHSNYLDPRSFRQMRSRQEGSFFGIGIIISRRDGKVTVIAPMAGTPAAQKGLRAGDVIAGVGGQATEELTLDEVVDLVRGPEGSVVLLTIERPGLDAPFDVGITRARIPQDSVRFAFMIRPGVGYIRLSEFTSTSGREVHDAIEALEAQGMTDLVFDVRNNPGGQLDAAISISDVFLRKGQLIVSTRGRTPDSISTLAAPGHTRNFEGPLVVLVNEGSASASEIVAGAVQDHDRGLVVGETTWGKGLVQTVFTVRDTGLALTTARYYTPSGRSIQRDYDSFIDYITHRNGAPEEPSNTFETDAGRTVLGGGGITPDVEVVGRPFSENLVRLYGDTAFFRFAVTLLQGVPEAEQADFASRFEVDDEVVDRFFDWAVNEEILTPDSIAELRASSQDIEDVERGIHIEVLNATLGLEAGYRVAVEADDQIEAALDLLPDADDMWRVWQERNGT